MRSGIRLGKIFNIEIFLDYSWIIIFIILTFLFAWVYYPAVLPGFSLPHRILLAFATSILFFASSFLHELTHSLVALKNKIKVRRIILFLFGGMSELFEEPPSAEKEFKIAVSGPTTSLALAVIFAFLWTIFDKYLNIPALIVLTATLFQANLILAFFNLLPGFPLDGGRIMRSIYWAATKDFKKATLIASTGGHVVAIFLIFFGILQVVLTGNWAGIWLILIGLFLNQAASQSYLELEIKDALSGLAVRNFAKKDVLCLSPNLLINDALSEYFINYASMSFPVVEGERVVGLISLADIRRNAKKLSFDSRVSDIMRNYPDNLNISPEAKVLDSFKLMIEKNVSFIPVLENNKISGMITLETISEYLVEKKII